MEHKHWSLPVGRRWKRWSAVAAAVVTAVATAGCGGTPGSPGAGGGGGGSGSKGPVTVGLLFPQSGTVAAAGTDMLHGWQLYFKLHGNTVAGRTINSMIEDTAGDPTTTLTKARKLVEQNGAKVLVGPLLANTAYALAGYLKATPGVIGLNPAGSSDDLSQRKRVKNYIRAGGWQSSTPVQPGGDYAYTTLHWRRVLTICQGYAFGYENCGGFVNTFTDHGGKIVKQLYPPLGTSDYSSYLSQIDPKSIDGVFATVVGADSPKFIQAWNQLGLKGKVPLITNETTLEQSTLRGIKNNDPVGLQSFGHFAEGRQDPATQNFVKEYQQAYGELPSYYACSTFTAAQWMAQAVQNVNGDIGNTQKFLQALDSVKLKDSCFGPMSLDQYGGTVANVYLRKVVRQGNNLVNVVQKTYPNVSQFWYYKPQAFLAQPVYSQSYAGQNWPTSCAAYVEHCPLQGGAQ